MVFLIQDWWALQNEGTRYYTDIGYSGSLFQVDSVRNMWGEVTTVQWPFRIRPLGPPSISYWVSETGHEHFAKYLQSMHPIVGMIYWV